ncbi:MAG: glutamate formimidoyltransferase [Acidobacteria bacterium]|nr:glutamate formimidoyltransferase [Acidobacteriota bacterium]
MNKIVECVPNFSEGRRPEVIDAIVKAITSVNNVYLLDREMDADHNRAVITVVGPPESIGQAAVRGVEAAMNHIDLSKHQGEHPRVGATDVIPFVPIRGVTLDDCVQIARTVGKEISEKFKIPVYLYEAAATRPDRTNLENIRRGQFEGLREEIQKNPDRKPDFGEARIHLTAGATVVGARKPLIAYNINLSTSDVAIAKQIAKRIRFSSGGFRFVKGMGVFLKDRNLAQVSMNLTDYEQTSIELVFETVRREAERYGVSIVGSEIVGLIPQKALEQAAEFYLRVENFKPSMILENRLAELMSGTGRPTNTMAAAVRPFIDRVASTDPVPGGGSVAALAGALGTALGQMAIRLTKDKKNFQQHSERYLDALDRMAPYREALLELIDADSEAFNQVMAAYKIPKDSPEREQAIQAALIRATDIPSRTANCAAEALRVLEELRAVIHPNVASDLQVALHMLRTSVRGAIANMRINLNDVKDADVRLRYEDMIVSLEQVLRGS